MKLSIMQPYVFPYIGYFQLINTVDKFVFYDDVNFIKQGWINRNRILLNGKDFLFTVPLKDASSFKPINEILLDQKNFINWLKNFYKTIEVAYKKAPYFKQVYELIRFVFDVQCNTISQLAINSIVAVCKYLLIATDFIFTSSEYNNNSLKAQERVIDICKKEAATEYINPVGGSLLYSSEVFSQNKIILKFLSSNVVAYKQFSNPFVPGLSIIDLIMFNSVGTVHDMLFQCKLA